MSIPRMSSHLPRHPQPPHAPHPRARSAPPPRIGIEWIAPSPPIKPLEPVSVHVRLRELSSLAAVALSTTRAHVSSLEEIHCARAVSHTVILDVWMRSMVAIEGLLPMCDSLSVEGDSDSVFESLKQIFHDLLYAAQGGASILFQVLIRKIRAAPLDFSASSSRWFFSCPVGTSAMPREECNLFLDGLSAFSEGSDRVVALGRRVEVVLKRDFSDHLALRSLVQQYVEFYVDVAKRTWFDPSAMNMQLRHLDVSVSLGLRAAKAAFVHEFAQYDGKHGVGVAVPLWTREGIESASYEKMRLQAIVDTGFCVGERSCAPYHQVKREAIDALLVFGKSSVGIWRDYQGNALLRKRASMSSVASFESTGTVRSPVPNAMDDLLFYGVQRFFALRVMFRAYLLTMINAACSALPPSRPPAVPFSTYISRLSAHLPSFSLPSLGKS